MVACALPLALGLAGVDLGSSPLPGDGGSLAARSGEDLAEALYQAMWGPSLHLLLDWTAVLLALVTGALALLRHRLRRDPVTAVLGLAMLGAGIVDAFHTLSASHLVLPAAATGDYVEFSWAISRVWLAGAVMLGALVFVLRPEWAQRLGSRSLAAIGIAFGGSAWLLVNLLIATRSIPPMVHPGALFPRPWDIFPLLLFLVSGALVLPRLHLRVPSVFTHALLFSTVPHVAAELHMALGAHAPFDHDHNAAHVLRLLAYGVVAAGLVVDYLEQHRRVRRQALDLAAAVAAVGLLNRDLRRTVDELEQFAYAASHDLKAPLRAVASIGTWLEEDLAEGRLDDVPGHLALMRQRLRRAERLLEDLRAFARIGQAAPRVATVDCGELVDGVVAVLAPPEGFVVERQGPFPTLTTAPGLLEQVFQNLVANAIKHHDHPSGHVLLRASERADHVEFEVCDDGPGIPPDQRDRVFQVFKTLRPRDEVEGSGMGLAIVKKTVESAGGRIEIADHHPRGACFRFTWPRAWPERRAP